MLPILEGVTPQKELIYFFQDCANGLKEDRMKLKIQLYAVIKFIIKFTKVAHENHIKNVP